jgi:hypothetical protein
MTGPITPLVPGAASPWMAGTDPTNGASGRLVGRRLLPLPFIPTGRTRDRCYAMATVDSSGRLGDRGLLEFLRWAPGTPVIAEMAAHSIIVIIAAPGGGQRVSAQGRLRLPAALRHRCGLRAGDRLLQVADRGVGRLRLYPSAALDVLLPDPTDGSEKPSTTGGRR